MDFIGFKPISIFHQITVMPYKDWLNSLLLSLLSAHWNASFQVSRQWITAVVWNVWNPWFSTASNFHLFWTMPMAMSPDPIGSFIGFEAMKPYGVSWSPWGSTHYIFIGFVTKNLMGSLGPHAPRPMEFLWVSAQWNPYMFPWTPKGFNP